MYNKNCAICGTKLHDYDDNYFCSMCLSDKKRMEAYNAEVARRRELEKHGRPDDWPTHCKVCGRKFSKMRDTSEDVKDECWDCGMM